MTQAFKVKNISSGLICSTVIITQLVQKMNDYILLYYSYKSKA